MTDRYDDIINLERPRSGNRRPMPLEMRAAQFAPFAALSGHEAAIAETARLTYGRIELTDDRAAEISRVLGEAVAMIDRHPTLGVTYFRADRRKAGGAYVTATGPLTRYDEYERTIKIGDTVIDIADIYEITWLFSED